MSKGRTTTRSADSPALPARVSEILATLPSIPELRSFVDLLVTRSVADPERRWSGSGELGTVGDRLVDSAGLEEDTARLGPEEAERLSQLFLSAARVVAAIARRDSEGTLDALLQQGLSEESFGHSP